MPIAKIDNEYKILKLERIFTYCFASILLDNQLSYNDLIGMLIKCTKDEKNIIIDIIEIMVDVRFNKSMTLKRISRNLIEDKYEIKNKLLSFYGSYGEILTKIKKLINKFMIYRIDFVKNINKLISEIEDIDFEKNHPELVFPGGRQDRTDKTIVHTAFREFYEEVGLSLEDKLNFITLPPLLYPSKLSEDNKYYSSIVFPILIKDIDRKFIEKFKPCERIFNSLKVLDFATCNDRILTNYFLKITNKIDTYICKDNNVEEIFINYDNLLKSDSIKKNEYFKSFNSPKTDNKEVTERDILDFDNEIIFVLNK